MSEECSSCEYNRQCFIKKNVGIFECEKEIIDNLNDEIWSSTGAECLDKLKSYIEDLQQKVEQLENIRKEAIEYVKEHARIDDEYPAYIEMLLEEKQDLLNILNKGDNDEKK